MILTDAPTTLTGRADQDAAWEAAVKPGRVGVQVGAAWTPRRGGHGRGLLPTSALPGLKPLDPLLAQLDPSCPADLRLHVPSVSPKPQQPPPPPVAVYPLCFHFFLTGQSPPGTSLPRSEPCLSWSQLSPGSRWGAEEITLTCGCPFTSASQRSAWPAGTSGWGPPLRRCPFKRWTRAHAQ